MPRLNDSEYHDRRIALRTDWDTGGTLICQLSSDQQWALHDFYLLTRPLDSADIEATRTQALIAHPELTTNAGLAYRSFGRLLATQHRQPVAAGKKPTQPAAVHHDERRAAR